MFGDGDVLGLVPWGLKSSRESIGDVPEGVWADESDGHVDVPVQLCNEGVDVSFPRSFSLRSASGAVSSPCVCEIWPGIVPKTCGVNGLWMPGIIMGYPMRGAGAPKGPRLGAWLCCGPVWTIDGSLKVSSWFG